METVQNKIPICSLSLGSLADFFLVFFLLPAGGVTVTTGVLTLGLEVFDTPTGVLGTANSDSNLYKIMIN